MLNLKLYRSAETDAAFNLAYEQYLLEHAEPDTLVFYLWQNDATVVIGKHQNPYKECRLDALRADGVQLVRRATGGGAVYHDLGNLNFTFVTDAAHYDVAKQCGVILDALRTFGIEGQMSGRNDLTTEGLKFSGNAYMTLDDAHLHHGTVLVDADLTRLAHYLTVSEAKIASKGIDSVKSRVVNLRTLEPTIDTECLIRALFETFCKTYGTTATVQQLTEDTAPQAVLDAAETYRTWQWLIGETPAFDASYSHKFSWGLFELAVTATSGRIATCLINTDALQDDAFSELASALPGTPLDAQALKTVLFETLDNASIADELSTWLGTLF